MDIIVCYTLSENKEIFFQILVTYVRHHRHRYLHSANISETLLVWQVLKIEIYHVVCIAFADWLSTIITCIALRPSSAKCHFSSLNGKFTIFTELVQKGCYLGLRRTKTQRIFTTACLFTLNLKSFLGTRIKPVEPEQYTSVQTRRVKRSFESFSASKNALIFICKGFQWNFSATQFNSGYDFDSVWLNKHTFSVVQHFFIF